MTTDTRPRAVFSRDRKHRYTLRRQLDPMLGQGVCCFIMCNSSTANEFQDDPTVRRCIDFARSWGFQQLVVVNLFALRSTDPKSLYTTKGDPIGGLNDGYILQAVIEADLVVCAWGNHGALKGRSKDVLAQLQPFGAKIQHLGMTSQGEPGHPLYLPKTSQLQEIAA